MGTPSSTATTVGYADYDWFRCDQTLESIIDLLLETKSMAKGRGSSGPTRRHVVKSGASPRGAAAVPHHGVRNRADAGSRRGTDLVGGSPREVDAELVWARRGPGALRLHRIPIIDAHGRAVPVPVQSAAGLLADGTLKWTGHAASGQSMPTNAAGTWPVVTAWKAGHGARYGRQDRPAQCDFKCDIPKSGPVLIESVQKTA